MKRDKIKTIIWWSALGIPLALIIIGMIVMVAGSSNVGAWICLSGLFALGLFLFLLIILALPNIKSLILFLGVIAVIIAVVALALDFGLGVIGGAVLCVVVLFIGFFLKNAIDNAACPRCGKKFSMKEISREVVSSQATTVNVDRYIRATNGKILKTYTEAVPATRVIYECVDKCKHCGYQRRVRRDATYRD